MGTNNKNYPDHQRTFSNTSPSNKKSSPGSQRPSPSKSISIKTPNKSTCTVAAGSTKNNYFNNNNNSCNNSNNATRLSLSGSPSSASYFAASKCFESPSANSLPKPPATWCNNMNNSTTKSSCTKIQASRVRKALIMPSDNFNSTCAMAFSAVDKNDHFMTQNLKLLLNVNA